MAAQNTNNLTLLDWSKRVDPQGKVPIIANLLSQTNEMLTDMVWRVANDATSHTEIVTTQLPTPSFRAFNEGIAATKGQTMPIVEGMGMLEARSEVDVDLANLNGEAAAFRESEDSMFYEAMNQQMQDTYIYGNAATSPKSFTGFATRYNSVNAAVNNSSNVISGDTGTPTSLKSTSIFLICWGDQTVFGIFPRGSKAGLQHIDRGIETVYTTDGSVANRMLAYVSIWQWKAGLCIKDHRNVVRIGNIDTTNFSALVNEQAPTTFTNLLHQMMIALAKIPNRNAGRCVFYANKAVHACLYRLALEKSNAALSIDGAATQLGMPGTLRFLGYPIRQVDRIINTEAALST